MNSNCYQCGKRCGLNSSYFRQSDRKKIKQFRCRTCGILFSEASFTLEKWQKKRSENQTLGLVFGSGVCLSRAARMAGVNYATIVRKMNYLAKRCFIKHELWKKSRENSGKKVEEIYLDEMITFEHTRCKPVAICMIVSKEREVLAFSVEPMPAIGKHLRKIALRKYGKRRNYRARGMRACLRAVKPLVSENVVIKTDEEQFYKRLIRSVLPNAVHQSFPSKRASIAGQDELKDRSFDELFAINHTFAMFRAFVSRLIRKTWAHTKKIQKLIEHLWIYMDLHNSDLKIRLS